MLHLTNIKSLKLHPSNKILYPHGYRFINCKYIYGYYYIANRNMRGMLNNNHFMDYIIKYRDDFKTGIYMKKIVVFISNFKTC